MFLITKGDPRARRGAWDFPESQLLKKLVVLSCPKCGNLASVWIGGKIYTVDSDGWLSLAWRCPDEECDFSGLLQLLCFSRPQ